MRSLLNRLVAARWCGLAVALVLVPLHAIFTNTSVLFAKDNARYFWPAHLWLRRTILAGESPLWDPYFAFGHPAAADPVRQVFFPTLPLRLLLPEVLGYNLLTALPIPVAAVGTYMYLRRERTELASALGATLFAGTGFMLSASVFQNISWSAALVPWILWISAELARKPRVSRTATLALLFATQCLAGEPLTLSVTALLAVVTGAREAPAPKMLRAVASIGTAGVAGFLLTAVQTLPAMRAYRDSVRAVGYDASISNLQSFHPLALADALLPRVFGDTLSTASANWWGGIADSYFTSIYIGVGAVALAVAGIWSARNRRSSRLWMVVVPIATVFSLGRYSAVYPLVQRLFPPLLAYRGPAKYLVFVVFGLVVLASNGFDDLWESTSPSAARRRVVGVAVMTCVGAIVVGLGVAVFPRLPALLATYVGLSAAEDAGRSLAAGLGLSIPRLAALSAGLAIVVLSAGLRPRRVSALRWVVFALVVLDPLVANADLMPTAPVSLLGQPAWLSSLDRTRDERIYVNGRAGINFLGARDVDDAPITGIQLLVGLPGNEIDAFVASNMAFVPGAYRVREAIGFDATALTPMPYVGMLRQFRRADPVARAAFLRRVGVGLYLTAQPPASPSRVLTAPEALAPLVLYETSDAMPRAVVVGRVRVEPDSERASASLFEDASVADDIPVEREPTSESGVRGAGGAPSSTIVADHSAYVAVRATAPETGGYLVMKDAFDEGWTATVDEQPAEIVRAFGVFRAVRLAPGAHAVVFRFLPRPFVVGFIISIVTLVGLLAAIVIDRIARRRSHL